MPTSTNPKKIILKGTPIRKEGRAAAAITPGHLVTGVPGGIIAVHAIAGGFAAPAFAVEQDFLGKRITDAYALNDQVQYVVCRPGDEMYAFLAVGQNVAAGALLESAGNGSLRALTPAAPLTFASLVTGTPDLDPAIDNTITWTARNPGAAGNNIRIELIDTGVDNARAIVVNGDHIAVTLLRAGGAMTDTANALVAAIRLNAAANALVRVATASTGVMEADDDVLAGGTDAAQGHVVARAIQAVNNAAGPNPARIRVEVI